MIVAGYYGIMLVVHVFRHTIVAGDYVITLVVLVSVRLSVLDNNLSRCQWIFIKLGVSIDIVESGFC